MVIDIAPLTREEQAFVVAYVVRKLIQHRLSPSSPEFPDQILIFVDELGKFAPRGRPGTLATHLIDIAERGRSLGLSLVGAEQILSSVHPRVLGNAATRAYGRTPPSALQDRAYATLAPELRHALPHLQPGELIVDHAPLGRQVRVRFPRPVHRVPR